MNLQKYSSKKGKGRLSRNKWNLSILLHSLSSPSEKPPLKVDVPSAFGPAFIDKSSPKGSLHSTSISNEFKDQFFAHQLIKTFYGDLNQYQISSSLISLEERLDVILYRTGLPKSIFESRQWIKQGKILLNGSLITSVYSPVSLGSILHINHSNLSSVGVVAPHLSIKRVGPNFTIAIYKKPLDLLHIRYPKNLNIDKLLLAHSL